MVRLGTELVDEVEDQHSACYVRVLQKLFAQFLDHSPVGNAIVLYLKL